MPELIVVAKKDQPARLVYLNGVLMQMATNLAKAEPMIKKLEQAAGINAKFITVRGKPKPGETVADAFYRMGKAYLGYRENCVEKRRGQREGTLVGMALPQVA